MRRKRIGAIITGVLCFFLMLWFWPNFVHEPLHWVALKMQGSGGTINFDLWHFPATPSITRSAPVAGIAGGLLFLMLPSVVSVLLVTMMWLWHDKHITSIHALLSHVVLPLYLVFDFGINVWKDELPQSDFHFLVALSGWWKFGLMCVVAVVFLMAMHMMYKYIEVSMHEDGAI
jgi:hypothetical protein